MIVLDSNVVSEALRIAPDERVQRWFDAQVAETLFLTTVGLAELRFGIALMPEGTRKQTLAQQLEDTIVPQFGGRILDFDEPATVAYADLGAKARQAGKTLGAFDALMAAVAVVHGFAVATRDTTPFEAAGVPVINPFAD